MQKLKDNEPRPKFTGSYKKKGVFQLEAVHVELFDLSYLKRSGFLKAISSCISSERLTVK